MSAALRVYVTKAKSVPVASLVEASQVVSSHIWRKGNPIPSSRWCGGNAGLVIDETGKKIARVSYNGRVWTPEPWGQIMKPTLIMEAQ